MSQSITVDSYPSGVTDFGTVFATTPQSIRDQIDAEIISPMFNSERNNDGHFVTVVIVGHADRRTDLGEDAARASELQASSDRANSARDFIFAEVQNALQASGGTVPVDRDSALTFAIAVFSSGAAQLVNPTAVAEADRLLNRRVEFFVQKFPKA